MPGSNAKRVVHSFIFHVGAAPERVFPLLCPVREYDWIDGWACQLVHSESGLVEQGCIFVTDHPPEGRTIWVTALHDPAAFRVEFLRVTPETHVSQMALSVAREGTAGSTVEVSYTFTALNDRGNALLALLEDGRALADRTGRLGRSIDYFLSTGAMLRPYGGVAAG
ncbi:MAG TPA: hypothetical protein VF341_05835 [Anaeromyxobacteraceae bacterium]